MKKFIFLLKKYLNKKDEISLNKKNLILFTNELSKLINAKISLFDAICILEDKYKNNKIGALLASFKKDLQLGYSFSNALSKYPNIFDNFFCSMIKTAEKTGALGEALSNLFFVMEKNQKLKNKLITPFLYPLFIFIFSIIVVIALFFFIIPNFAELLINRKLHFFTKAIVTISMNLNANKFFYFSSFSIFALLLIIVACLKQTKKQFYLFVAKIPIIKSFFIKISTIRFCMSFSILLKGGVSYLKAIRLANDVVNYSILKKQLNKVEENLRQGARLSEELMKNTSFPSSVSRMVAIAEESGEIVDMLNNIAFFYEDDLDKKMNKMIFLIQPILLLIVGSIVGIVVLSILMPLTDVGSMFEF